MDFRALVLRGLTYYWRTNLAVLLGVATASGVLAGALLTGDSVRASLRRLALERLGATETVVRSGSRFREALGPAIGAVPLITLEALVTHQSSGRRAAGVALYGVDDRFWKLHGLPSPDLGARGAAISPALASELGSAANDTILVRIEKPADIPAESVFGRKDGAAPAIRCSVAHVTPFEFSLRAGQAAVKAVYVPLSRLQRETASAGRANTLLSTARADELRAKLREAASLEDLGIRLRALPQAGSVQIDTLSGILSPTIVTAATAAGESLGLRRLPAMTYLTTAMKANGRETPYSLIAALPLAEIGVETTASDAVVLNDWTARDLGAKSGDLLTVEYLMWRDDGRLTTEKAELRVTAAVPMKGLAADRQLAPEYPGITDASNVADWDPPFPMDLGRIRPKDEDYWDAHRTTAKAFISVELGQKLWGSRWGNLTTLRFAPASVKDEGLDKALQEMRIALRKSLDPEANGLAVIPVREQSLAASRGATDFGEYFVYFSFFLVVSALMLAGLFFRLGVEQRHTETGLLRATGFEPRDVLRLYLAEGLVLALAGGLLGVLGALAYAGIVVHGLGTWWVDAAGTREISLHVSAIPLVAGVLGGVFAAAGAIWWTLRGIGSVSPRRLLSGGGTDAPAVGARSKGRQVAVVCGAFGLLLIGLSAAGLMPAAGGFFGAGALLLIAALAWFRAALVGSLSMLVDNAARFAFRNAGYRPGRTVLSAALIASATFLVVSVEAFRQNPGSGAADRKSGTGGYALIAESVRPVYFNLDTPAAREELNLPKQESLHITGLRLRPGDDASCLNLYQPKNPRVLGAPPALLASDRFSFAGSAGWKLLDQDLINGAIPAVADANSLAYVLHKSVGEEVTLGDGTRLVIVGALSHSMFQSELVVAERHFVRAFPTEQGFRVFLIDAPAAEIGQVSADLEKALSDHGFDAVSTAERLAAFHRVENTYLSTFQTLGGLGLLLGTVGLAAVLFRNVLERRRELALLTATGYGHAALSSLVLRENLVMLLAGLAAGTAAAALAIAPVLASRGVNFSVVSLALLLLAVFLAGLLAAWLATRIALRRNLVSSLRAG